MILKILLEKINSLHVCETFNNYQRIMPPVSITGRLLILIPNLTWVLSCIRCAGNGFLGLNNRQTFWHINLIEPSPSVFYTLTHVQIYFLPEIFNNKLFGLAAKLGSADWGQTKFCFLLALWKEGRYVTIYYLYMTTVSLATESPTQIKCCIKIKQFHNISLNKFCLVFWQNNLSEQNFTKYL